MKACKSIPADQYSTAMLFNPPGYRTLYLRSQCLQELAVEERDANLCRQVRERKSWFFDGSGISPHHCRTLVAERREADRRHLAALDLTHLHRLVGVEVLRDGNGRDFDLLATTRGSLAAEYTLRVTARRPDGEPVEIFSDRNPLGSAPSRRSLLMTRRDLATTLGADWESGDWQLRATLELAKTRSNRFYWDRIPGPTRSSSRELRVAFDDLPPWHPSPN